MLVKCVIGVFVISIALNSVRLEDVPLQNEIMDSNYNGDQMKYNSRNNNNNMNNANAMEVNNYPADPPKETWFDSARNALSGPAGQIVVHMAKEMISRSTGNSQVRRHLCGKKNRKNKIIQKILTRTF